MIRNVEDEFCIGARAVDEFALVFTIKVAILRAEQAVVTTRPAIASALSRLGSKISYLISRKWRSRPAAVRCAELLLNRVRLAKFPSSFLGAILLSSCTFCTPLVTFSTKQQHQEPPSSD